MSKKYNLGKKSDMRKLQRDLEKQAKKTVEQATRQLNIQCPSCGRKLKVTKGINTCPSCKSKVEYNR